MLERFYRDILASRKEMRIGDEREGALKLMDAMNEIGAPIDGAIIAYNRMYADSTLRVPTNPQTYADMKEAL